MDGDEEADNVVGGVELQVHGDLYPRVLEQFYGGGADFVPQCPLWPSSASLESDVISRLGSERQDVWSSQDDVPCGSECVDKSVGLFGFIEPCSGELDCLIA